MSFFSDLGGFINQVQQVTDFTDEIKQGIVSNVKDTVVNIETQGADVASQLQSTADSVTKVTQDTSDDIKSNL